MQGVVTELVLHVVLINAQCALPVITKGVGVSFSLFIIIFFFWRVQRVGQEPDRKYVAGGRQLREGWASVAPKKASLN